MPKYNPDVELPPRQCNGCGETYPRVPEFWSRNKQCLDGLTKTCKECRKDGCRRARLKYRNSHLDQSRRAAYEWRQKHIEKARLYSRQYKQTNSERICAINQHREARKRALPHTLTAVQYAETLAYFDHTCAYCGVPQSELDYTLHQEHILPQIRGGGYTRDNIVPACRQCNDHKHAKTPEEAGMKLIKSWPIPQSIEAS